MTRVSPIAAMSRRIGEAFHGRTAKDRGLSPY